MDRSGVIEQSVRIGGAAVLTWLLFVAFVAFEPFSYVVVVGITGLFVLYALRSIHGHVVRSNDSDYSSAK